ncbi:hypothetical protein FRC07_005070 [Ceratobasidium sp. 392]|nr:hypothetical protein FRC07_005070 [Ceratobasidium sp. 392]
MACSFFELATTVLIKRNMNIPLENITSRASSSIPSDLSAGQPTQEQDTRSSRHERLQGPGSSTAPQMIHASQESTAENNESVPPADRGVKAWMYLIGAFVVQTVVWSTHFSYPQN